MFYGLRAPEKLRRLPGMDLAQHHPETGIYPVNCSINTKRSENDVNPRSRTEPCH